VFVSDIRSVVGIKPEKQELSSRRVSALVGFMREKLVEPAIYMWKVHILSYVL
jgi:hypothetical protein